MWDPETQTYTDGVVPSHHGALEIEELLQCNDGKLKIFGYGSLCWHPGSDGVLSLANTNDAQNDSETSNKVTTRTGRAIGYQRCWCQRSADHRGTTEFNGIVCTLLSDDEIRSLHHDSANIHRPSLTEGMIYTVDKTLVEDCLAELDFREKGGYARDVIDVVEDGTDKTVKALLYRGTPDNPAFWKRAYLDLPYAAAIMSVSIGPSGRNDAYLLHLHEFLSDTESQSKEVSEILKGHTKDDRTGELANMVKLLQSDYHPYFLFGTGSNEYNQLLLNSKTESSNEVSEMTELLLVVPRNKQSCESNAYEPKSLHAGGGHSALLTNGGHLYMWGWNTSGQLGRINSNDVGHGSFFNSIEPLNILVEDVSLGHTHTLVIEKGTRRIKSFGDNGRAQVTGFICSNDSYHDPKTPSALSDERFIDVGAGLFHSAAINEEGELITWGCSRFHQCLDGSDDSSTIGRWRPFDGSKLKKVACGRRHTVALDEHGRVWCMGDNKYGQLGRSSEDVTEMKYSSEPQLVDGLLGEMQSGCFAIYSGWSHILALVKNKDSNIATLYGWGRNDKRQLGESSNNDHVFTPQAIAIGYNDIPIQSACCGAETSHILDAVGNIHSTGWNEHGNLGIGERCDSSWKITSGAIIVTPPPRKLKTKLFAAGGAHLIATAVSRE